MFKEAITSKSNFSLPDTFKEELGDNSFASSNLSQFDILDNQFRLPDPIWPPIRQQSIDNRSKVHNN